MFVSKKQFISCLDIIHSDINGLAEARMYIEDEMQKEISSLSKKVDALMEHLKLDYIEGKKPTPYIRKSQKKDS